MGSHGSFPDVTHRHMSSLLTKELPDVMEGCQGTLPSGEKTQGQPAPDLGCRRAVGQGHTVPQIDQGLQSDLGSVRTLKQ